MRFILSFVLVVISVVGLSACNSKEMIASPAPSTPPAEQEKTPPPANDGAPRITAAELHDLWVKGKVLVIDTRLDDAYKQSHINGAISVPVTEFVAKMDQLPRDKKIVAYCT
jgi:rhodanese-related sulfurtransferase